MSLAFGLAFVLVVFAIFFLVLPPRSTIEVDPEWWVRHNRLLRTEQEKARLEREILSQENNRLKQELAQRGLYR